MSGTAGDAAFAEDIPGNEEKLDIRNGRRIRVCDVQMRSQSRFTRDVGEGAHVDTNRLSRLLEHVGRRRISGECWGGCQSEQSAHDQDRRTKNQAHGPMVQDQAAIKLALT